MYHYMRAEFGAMILFLLALSLALPASAQEWILPSQTCYEGQVRNCGSDVGACTTGTSTCTDGEWGKCTGGVVPSIEVCGNGIDDNCDGKDDNCDVAMSQTLVLSGIALFVFGGIFAKFASKS